MKTVVSTSDVAHFWAHQSQCEARTSNGNFYFDGKTIYSYGRHFPIATHHTNEAGESAVLFTTRGYSNSTAKHIGHVRGACSHLVKIYCKNPNGISHTENFNDWANKILQETQKLGGARKPEIYIGNIEAIKAEAKKYADYFGLELPVEITADIDMGKAKESYSVLAERARERKQKEKQDNIEQREKWLNFKAHSYRPIDGRELLRTDGEKIETTKGVCFGVDYGRAFYKRLKSGAIRHGDKFKQYVVLSVTEKDLKIGCHTFSIDYLMEFSAKYLS